MERPYDFGPRSELFACEIVAFCRAVAERGVILRRLACQLVDAGTSIGANLAESGGGQSKRDFIAKTYVALKESRESRYWLRVIGRSEPPMRDQARVLEAEASEWVAMLSSSLRTAQSRDDRRPRSRRRSKD
jgi:four helix bundle protein